MKESKSAFIKIASSDKHLWRRGGRPGGETHTLSPSPPPCLGATTDGGCDTNSGRLGCRGESDTAGRRRARLTCGYEPLPAAGIQRVSLTSRHCSRCSCCPRARLLFLEALLKPLYTLTVLNNLLHMQMLIQGCLVHSEPRGGAVTFQCRDTSAKYKPEENRKWDFAGKVSTTAMAQSKGESNVRWSCIWNIKFIKIQKKKCLSSSM